MPRAVVLRGEGGVFCAGADVSVFGAPGMGDFAPRDWVEAKERGADLHTAMTAICSDFSALDIPSIADVTGAALGGGAELATAAMFRVWHPSATFALVHRSMGLVPGFGARTRLHELVGEHTTRVLLVRGTRTRASEAERIGLCDAVTDAEDDRVSAVVSAILGPASPTTDEGAVEEWDVLRSLATRVAGDHNDSSTFNRLWTGPRHRAALSSFSKKHPAHHEAPEHHHAFTPPPPPSSAT